MALPRNDRNTTRRDCIKLGLGAALGTGFVDLLRLRSSANENIKSRGVARSCILIWLDGGPTHYETFDPKPQAPSEIRGEFFPNRHSIARCSVSEHMTQLAAMADQLSIIRSIRHDQGNHGAGNHYMMTGAPPRIPVGCGAFVSFHPSLGSVTAHQRGHQNGLPAYFTLPSMTRSGGPNFLGAQYAPFAVPNDPNSSSFRVRDVALPKDLEQSRFDDRRDLRGLVDQLPRFHDRAAGDPVLALDEYYQQGYDLIASTAAQAAFDIHQEEDTVRDLYGRNSFGQRALLAPAISGSGGSLYHSERRGMGPSP